MAFVPPHFPSGFEESTETATPVDKPVLGTPVVVTGIKLDIWSIFVLVLMVSISQAIIGGLALLVLHRFGVV